jgi:WD40 repeat protein
MSRLAGVELLKRRWSLLIDENPLKHFSFSALFFVVFVFLLAMSLRYSLARTDAELVPPAPPQAEREKATESFSPNPVPLHGSETINGVAIAPDGQRIVSASLDHTVKIWQGLPQPVRLLRGHTGPVANMVISHDGRRLLSGNGTVRWWDTATGQQRKLFRQSGFVKAVKFSPDGRYALSAGGGRNDNGNYVPSGNDFPIHVWSLGDESTARG